MNVYQFAPPEPALVPQNDVSVDVVPPTVEPVSVCVSPHGARATAIAFEHSAPTHALKSRFTLNVHVEVFQFPSSDVIVINVFALINVPIAGDCVIGSVPPQLSVAVAIVV